MDRIEGLLIIFVILAVGSYWGCYKLGRYLERRDLTSALVNSIEETYLDGHMDAERDCRQGLIH